MLQQTAKTKRNFLYSVLKLTFLLLCRLKVYYVIFIASLKTILPIVCFVSVRKINACLFVLS